MVTAEMEMIADLFSSEIKGDRSGGYLSRLYFLVADRSGGLVLQLNQ